MKTESLMMQLVFEVCEGEGAGTAPAARKIFDGAGGVIGRGPGCDWVISDPSRVLSSHHGLIAYREGHYFLTDISSNGIQVAGSAERLRKGQARLINDGDAFHLGSLLIRAWLMEPTRSRAEQQDLAGEPIPDDAFLSLDPLQALDLEHQRQSSSADLAALNRVIDEPQAWTDSHGADREHVVLPRRAEPIVEAAAVAPVAVAPTVDEVFWAQFTAVLGIDPVNLDRSSYETLAIKVARLFRLAVEGLQQSLRTRDELKNEMASAPADSHGATQNPLKDCVDTDAAIAAILGPRELGQLSGERAIVHAYRDLQAHQVALLAACESALLSARAAFEPGHLLRCFETQGKPPRFFTDGGHWRAYLRHYQRLVLEAQRNEPALGTDFAKAYAQQLRLISTLHSDFPG